MCHSLSLSYPLRSEFADYADLARGLVFTRARVTQLVNLRLIATDVQEEILFLEVPPGRQPITEHALRAALRAGFEAGRDRPRPRRPQAFRTQNLNAR